LAAPDSMSASSASAKLVNSMTLMEAHGCHTFRA
jgi:hypothetical protein